MRQDLTGVQRRRPRRRNAPQAAPALPAPRSKTVARQGELVRVKPRGNSQIFGPLSKPSLNTRTRHPASAQHHRFVLPSGPRGDAPQTRAKDTRRAEKYKATPVYGRQIARTQAETTKRDLAAALAGVGHTDPLVKHHQGPLASVVHAGENFLTGAFRAAYPSVEHVKEGTPGASLRIGAVPTLATATTTGVGSLPGKTVKNVLEAGWQSPGQTAEHTLKGGRDSLLGIPGAAVGLIVNPRGTVKQIGADYSRRYGPLLAGTAAGEKQFRERIKKEGAFAEGADLVTAAIPTGIGVGALGGNLARAGKLGATLERVATDARPALRVSGGVARDQPVSRNLIVAGAQRARDKTRVRVRDFKGRHEDAPALIRVAQQHGDVVPIRPGVVAHRQRRLVAAQKGRALHTLRGEQAREVHKGAAVDIAHLNKHERAGVKYAVQLGLPADPKIAVRELEARKAAILAERAKRPDLYIGRSNEIPVIDGLIANAEKTFTPRLRATADLLNERVAKAAAGDPGVAFDQAALRRVSQQAEHMGITRHDGETVPQYVVRVHDAAAAQGLHPPGYFRSEKRPAGVFSSFAVGGRRTVAAPKRYSGELFRTGRENASPEVMVQSLAQNIKRKHNWNLVATNAEAHTFHDLGEKSIQAHLDQFEQRGIDPNSVAFWNPGKYADARHNFDASAATDPTHGLGEEPSAQGVGAAVDQSMTDVKGLLTQPKDFKNSTGWRVIPKAVYDEIHSDTRPSGAAGRSFDIVKGKQSRILLGLSPSWLQFQVASNALLTGLAGTGPIDAIKAQAFWRKLPPEEQAAVEPFIGYGHFAGDVQQTKLGSAANNQLVNAYRALKDTPVWRRAGKANPLDAMFRVDNAQNNFFRKAVLYSQVKRDAYARMGANAGQAMALQSQLVHILKLGPEDQMRAILRDQPALEKHAEHVNDFLGDYTTYTAKERRTLGRAVMFYGFLRYSLRFTFWTMPIKHPLMSAIVANLGRMETDEVRKLLGGDELPYALGKFYWTSGGKLKSVDLQRANPAMNALTQINLRDPRTMLGVLPPMAVALLDQAYSKSSFRGRDFTVQGETPGKSAARKGHYSLADRGRIFAEQMLQLAAPYRTAEKVTSAGPQGDDSLLFSRRPTQYKRPDIVRSINADRARAQRTPLLLRIGQQLTPVLAQDSNDPAVAAAIRQQQGKATGKKKPKRRRSGYGSGMGSGLGSGLGGGLTGGGY